MLLDDVYIVCVVVLFTVTLLNVPLLSGLTVLSDAGDTSGPTAVEGRGRQRCQLHLRRRDDRVRLGIAFHRRSQRTQKITRRLPKTKRGTPALMKRRHSLRNSLPLLYLAISTSVYSSVCLSGCLSLYLYDYISFPRH